MKWPNWRQRILLAALALTIVLALQPGEGQDSTQPVRAATNVTAAATVRNGPGKSAAQVPPRVELERMRRPEQAAARPGNLFGAMSWYVPPPPPPPPPPPKPVPPPPPTAPPMPFSFLGRYVDGERQTILLVKGERIYTVAEGEVIENTYRVERLQGGVLEMTYLPLNIKQTITTGQPA